jgi:transglutaminase-like putative cysteine protease
MIYQIVHTTEYRYSTPAEACHNLLRLDPRTSRGQSCLEFTLEIEPAPARLHTYVDYFGNQVRSFAILAPHERLSITSRSRVTVERQQPADLADSPAWSSVRNELHERRDEATVDALQYVFNSPYVRSGDALGEYALPSFPADKPLLAGAFDLTRRIYADFAYDPSATTIDTSIEDVLERRRGVCQDFAHLQIGCLRSLGLAARYVSGYLRTQTRPDETRLAGADASHAWTSVYCPRNGWTSFDPTNGCLVAEDHIVLGWGRDYHDVSPVKGVVLGGVGSTLRVAVRVAPE